MSQVFSREDRIATRAVTATASQTTSVVAKASVSGIAHTMHEAVSWTEANLG